MMGRNRKHAYLPCFDSSCCSNWIKTLVGNHQIAMRCAAVLPNWRALLVKWLQTTSNICHMVGAHRGIKQKCGHLQQCSVSTGKFQKEVGYFLYKYIMCRAVCSEIVSSHFHRLWLLLCTTVRQARQDPDAGLRHRGINERRHLYLL